MFKMMRAVGIGFVVAMMLVGCARVSGHLTLSELASSNQQKLSGLLVGMSKQDVLLLMGNATAKTGDGIVNNPWTVESFIGRQGEQYETLDYATRKNQPFTPLRKSLATPQLSLNKGR